MRPALVATGVAAKLKPCRRTRLSTKWISVKRSRLGCSAGQRLKQYAPARHAIRQKLAPLKPPAEPSASIWCGWNSAPKAAKTFVASFIVGMGCLLMLSARTDLLSKAAESLQAERFRPGHPHFPPAAQDCKQTANSRRPLQPTPTSGHFARFACPVSWGIFAC